MNLFEPWSQWLSTSVRWLSASVRRTHQQWLGTAAETRLLSMSNKRRLFWQSTPTLFQQIKYGDLNVVVRVDAMPAVGEASMIGSLKLSL